jgi:hypothetical protein
MPVPSAFLLHHGHSLPNYFSTTFPNTENPITSGVTWTQGGTDGIDWQNVRSTGGSPGTAYGVGPVLVTYEDCLATVQNRFNPNKHYAEITVRKDGGYVPPDTHEIEILVGYTISANSVTGYEMDFGFGNNLQPVRLQGSKGNFDTTVFTVVSGNYFSASDGDVIRAYFDSTSGSPIITMYLNGVQQIQFTDTTAGKYVSGSPGMGFFARAGSGLDMTKYSAHGFACGNW